MLIDTHGLRRNVDHGLKFLGTTPRMINHTATRTLHAHDLATGTRERVLRVARLIGKIATENDETFSPGGCSRDGKRF